MKVPNFRNGKYEALRRHLLGINWIQFESRLGQDGSRRAVHLNEVISGMEGEIYLEVSGVADGMADNLDPYDKESVDGLYAHFTRGIITAQSHNVPYKLVRLANGDSRWMTDTIEYKTGLKRGISARMTRGEANIRDRYFQRARKVKE